MTPNLPGWPQSRPLRRTAPVANSLRAPHPRGTQPRVGDAGPLPAGAAHFPVGLAYEPDLLVCADCIPVHHDGGLLPLCCCGPTPRKLFTVLGISCVWDPSLVPGPWATHCPKTWQARRSGPAATALGLGIDCPERHGSCLLVQRCHLGRRPRGGARIHFPVPRDARQTNV